MHTPYTVSYGRNVAKFSNYADAMSFARMMSAEVDVDVRDKTGLIGQFYDGMATPEFAHLDAKRR